MEKAKISWTTGEIFIHAVSLWDLYKLTWWVTKNRIQHALTSKTAEKE